MKILVVVEPGINGVFRHAEALVDQLISSQHEVYLAYSSIRGSSALTQLVSRVRTSGGGTLDMRVSNEPTIRDAHAVLRLLLFYTSICPDIVHMHSSKAGFLGRCLWLLGARAALIYTPHAYYGLSEQKGVRAALFDIVEAYLAQFCMTINVSHSEAEYAEERLGIGAARRCVIYNSINRTRFEVCSSVGAMSFRLAHGIPSSAFVIGAVGRYSAQKDPRTLYAAALRVLGGSENAWFLHVGSGELMPMISNLIAMDPCRSRIVQIEYMENPAAAYNAMDLFVNCSTYEGLSIAVIEALYCGLPLVLSRCPGNVEFASIGLNRLRWVAPGDPEELAHAISGSMSMRQLANNHRRCSESVFGELRCFQRVVSLYVWASGVDGEI